MLVEEKRQKKIENTIEIDDFIEKKSNTIESLLKRKNDKRTIIILSVIIIILCILFTLFAQKLGRIGYRYGDIKQVGGNFDNISIIKLTRR